MDEEQIVARALTSGPARLSRFAEDLVAETMAELGLTDRPMIVFGGVPDDLHGLYELGPPSTIFIRSELPDARFRHVLRHELYHAWHARGGKAPSIWFEGAAEAFASRDCQCGCR